MEGIATETETACGNEAVVTKSASEPAAEKVEDVADSPGSNVVVVSGSQTGSSSYEESTEPLSSSSTVPDTTVADAGPFQRPSYVNRIHLMKETRKKSFSAYAKGSAHRIAMKKRL